MSFMQPSTLRSAVLAKISSCERTLGNRRQARGNQVITQAAAAAHMRRGLVRKCKEPFPHARCSFSSKKAHDDKGA